MNSRHRKTLAAIFKDPVSRTIVWKDVENLLVGLCSTLTHAQGSRLTFSYNTHILNMHKPHPQKEAKAYQIREVREFLTLTGHAPKPVPQAASVRPPRSPRRKGPRK